MSPTLRKVALTTHLGFAMGWFGALLAYLAVAVTALNTSDETLARALYQSLPILASTVIIPVILAAVATGLFQSWASPWGLFRHYWVAAKFALTCAAAAVLLVHLRVINEMAAVAADPTSTLANFAKQRLQLVVHPLGGLVVVIALVAFSVLKPWGATPFGRRRRVVADSESLPTSPGREFVNPQPSEPVSAGYLAIKVSLAKLCWVHAAIVVAIALVVHVANGGLHHH